MISSTDETPWCLLSETLGAAGCLHLHPHSNAYQTPHHIFNLIGKPSTLMTLDRWSIPRRSGDGARTRGLRHMTSNSQHPACGQWAVVQHGTAVAMPTASRLTHCGRQTVLECPCSELWHETGLANCGLPQDDDLVWSGNLATLN